MGDFNRDNRSGGGGRSRDFGRRDFGGRGDRQMHKAICSNCGKECEVPFKPTGSKPVFCSDCFEKNGGSSDVRRFGGGDRGPRRPSFEGRGSGQTQNSSQLGEINAKLDKILAMLGPSSAAKPARADRAPQAEVYRPPRVSRVPQAVRETEVFEALKVQEEAAEVVSENVQVSSEESQVPEKKKRTPRRARLITEEQV